MVKGKKCSNDRRRQANVVMDTGQNVVVVVAKQVVNVFNIMSQENDAQNRRSDDRYRSEGSSGGHCGRQRRLRAGRRKRRANSQCCGR